MKVTARSGMCSTIFSGACQLWQAGLGISLLGFTMTFAQAESEVEDVTNSPRGIFRIEQQRQQGEGKWQGTFVTNAWIIPTADPAKRERLGEPYDDSTGRHFFISPDEQWICATVHVHSQLQSVLLYQRKTGLQFDLVATASEEYEDGKQRHKWEFDPPDYFVPPGDPSSVEETGRVYNHFVAWSADSARLLVERRVEEHDEKAHENFWSYHYFYFDLRSGKLEDTNYLRTLDRTFRGDSELRNYVVPAFAEPVDPLPSEKQLGARYQAAEGRLNKIFPLVMKREQPEQDKQNHRDYQRVWLKARDKGAEAFAVMGPKADRERRRLEYMADATEARVRELEHDLGDRS
jgi:Lysozyme inhibitor LprI